MGQFNELQIRAAAPRDKEYLLADGEGLYLRVRLTGKVWVYRYKQLDKEAKLSLGHYPVVMLADARKKARAEAEKRADGVDPREACRVEEERGRVARLNTFELTARAWHAQAQKDREWSASYAEKVMRHLELHIFPWIGALAMDTIAPTEVVRYRVRRLMRENRLRTLWRRKFFHTTDSGHALPVSDNVLARRFNPSRPNQAWVSDITYIRTRSGWLYLAVVLDLYARKVVGWAMAPSMHAELVCAALQLAIAQRQPAPGLIVHSDRGSQYASALHQALLARHGLVGSMSRKGNCWDNAVMERFFLSLKTERIWQRDYANHAEAMTDIADYIVGFYNSVRLHSKLGNLPPNAFERQSAITQSIVVSEKT